MIRYVFLIFVCSVALSMSSCTVDCDYTCEDPTGINSDVEGSSRVRTNKCDDCDFLAVNLEETAGYDCECSH